MCWTRRSGVKFTIGIIGVFFNKNKKRWHKTNGCIFYILLSIQYEM